MSIRLPFVLAVVLAAFVSVNIAGAVEPAKITVEDADSVEAGEFELTLEYSVFRAKREWDSRRRAESRPRVSEHEFELELEYGLTDTLDLIFETGFESVKDREGDGPRRGSGWGDISIGAKWQYYYNPDADLALAYMGGFTLPTGRSESARRIGISQEYYSFDQKMIATKGWGLWSASADLGYSLPLGSKRDDDRGELTANIGVGYQVADWIKPVVELNYGREFIRGATNPDLLAVTVGAVMPLGDDWRVAAGVQRGIYGRSEEKGLAGIFAVTYEW